MIGLSLVFWILVALFAVVGAIRGWAKELLVTFSVIVSIFILSVMERYLQPFQDFVAPPNSHAEFWARTIVLAILVFFGYQTPNLQRISESRFAREKLSDSLLGLFLGALNGFLIFGTVWFFLEQSNYPFPKYIAKPEAGNPLSAPALDLLPALPPNWLGIPTIYFAVAISFLFVLIIFI